MASEKAHLENNLVMIIALAIYLLSHYQSQKMYSNIENTH